MLSNVLQRLGRVRDRVVRVRLRVWAATCRLRLRARHCDARFVIGSDVRCAALPQLRLIGDGGGRIVVEIADRVDLGRMLLLDVNVSGTSLLSIGAGTSFEHAVRIQLFGGEVRIGPDCEIRDAAVLKTSSEPARLAIGSRVKIGRGVGVHCHDSVSLRDLTTLADRVTIVDSFHDVDGSDDWTMHSPLRTAPVSVERNAIVLTGAVIGHDTVIGANSVVAANALVPSGAHPAGVVLVGNPARAVRKLTPRAAPDAADETD
jgi:acetyltransferase-like isoleucine patch superfamily enzyme